MGKTKYTFNEKCFDILDEKSLYWLGLLYADGCIHKNKYSNSYTTILALQTGDDLIIEKFKRFLGTNAQIYHQENLATGLTGLRIHNQTINRKLLQLGMIPRKSLVIKFPDFLLNHPLKSHFIRGYFDGDGCICEKKRKVKNWLHFTMTGTLDMMEKMSCIFQQELGIVPRKIIRQGKVYSLHVGRIEYVQKLKEYLYRNAAVFLERKKYIFDNHSGLKHGLTSKYHGVCFRKKTSRWRAIFYLPSGQRTEKGFLTEREAISYLHAL